MNLLKQTAIPLSKVPDKVLEIAGFRPNRSTVFRWKTRGCNGRKLATFRAGGRVCTTVEAILEFFKEDSDEDSPSVTDSTLDEAAAESYLEAEGI